jgi:hypothetical protein
MLQQYIFRFIPCFSFHILIKLLPFKLKSANIQQVINTKETTL